MIFRVERQVGSAWRKVHQVADDKAAAELAQALTIQTPTEAVRIAVEVDRDDGRRETKVVWEYAGSTPPSPPPAGPPAPRAAPHPPRRPAGDDDDDFVSTRVRHSLPPRGRGAARGSGVDRGETRRARGRLTLLVAGVGTLAVAIAVAWSIGVGPVPPRVGDDPAPRAATEARPDRAAQDPDAGGGRWFDAVTRHFSYLQVAVARRYAYTACVAENLRLGKEIVVDSYYRGRISDALLRTYDEQLKQVLAELNTGRAKLLSLPPDQGGLTAPLLDFIDEWFRLNRDFLWEGRRYDEIVNPEAFCRATAEEGDFLRAFFESRKHAAPERP